MRFYLIVVFICLVCSQMPDSYWQEFQLSLTPLESLWYGSDTCKYDGVDCIDLGGGFIRIQVNLSERGLSGTIPNSISNLGNIDFIDLSYNIGIGGNLPDISGISNLYIQHTSVGGGLPSTLQVFGTLDISYTNINLTQNCPSSSSYFVQNCHTTGIWTCDCPSSDCVTMPSPCALSPSNVPTVTPINNDFPSFPSPPTGSNDDNLIPIIAGSCGGAVFILLLILTVYFVRRNKKNESDDNQFLNKFLVRTGNGWVKSNGNCWLKEITEKSNDYQTFMEFDKILRGNDVFKYSKIHAISNENLAATFITYRKTLGIRHNNDPKLFVKKDWKSAKNVELREWAVKCYEEFITQFSWNEELKDGELPVILAVHGTSQSIAKKICETGFAALSTLDAGFYGKGIYFTCYIPYIYPYVSNEADPVMLVSLIFPGNIYPVTEPPTVKGSYLGKHIRSGYQSHYVKTLRTGLPCKTTTSKEHYDELVIEQEAQILPVFLVALDRSNFASLASHWNREIPEEARRRKLKKDAEPEEDNNLIRRKITLKSDDKKSEEDKLEEVKVDNEDEDNDTESSGSSKSDDD